MSHITWRALVTSLLCLSVAVLLLAIPATADPKTGIYWLSDTSADGVHVRRLEDTTYGVICYVAKADTGSGYPSVSVSCIKAKP